MNSGPVSGQPHNFHGHELSLQAHAVPACSQGQGPAHHCRVLTFTHSDFHLPWYLQRLTFPLGQADALSCPKWNFALLLILFLGEPESTFQLPVAVQSTIFTVLITKHKSTLAPAALPGREPCPGHSTGKGLWLTQEQCPPLLEPMLTAGLLHSAIRFYISLQHLLSVWKRWNRIKPTPNSFTFWYAQPKEGNR